MADSIFVQDGMTFTGKVPASPGVYPAVSFTYRPATFAVRAEYGAAAALERQSVACQIVSRQVQTLTAEGEPEPIRLTPEQAAKLHANLFGAIFDHVMGYVGPASDAAKN
jgi:hypothetical protein